MAGYPTQTTLEMFEEDFEKINIIFKTVGRDINRFIDKIYSREGKVLFLVKHKSFIEILKINKLEYRRI